MSYNDQSWSGAMKSNKRGIINEGKDKGMKWKKWRRAQKGKRKGCPLTVGLFAYAATVTRFVSDLLSGDPISQIQLILDLIDNTSLSQSATATAQPMAQLDTLY